MFRSGIVLWDRAPLVRPLTAARDDKEERLSRGPSEARELSELRLSIFGLIEVKTEFIMILFIINCYL